MAGGPVTYVLCWSLLVILTFASTSTTISPDAASKDISYWVSFAKRITPGKPLVTHVYLANLSQPVDLTLDLVDDDNTNLQQGQSFTLQGSGDIQIINFDISNNLTRPQDNSPSPKMFVRVRASRGLLFDEYEEVLWQEPSLNIFVQMSMLEYQLGQTVKFIAFVTSGLHVVKKPLDIVIENDGRYGGTPEKLAEWKQVQSGDKTGFYMGEFNTSSQTPTGQYQISVSAEGAKTYTMSFEVKEYMEFLVEIDYPIAVTASFEQINFNISTRTAEGFPVQGPCSVVARYPYWDRNGQELVKNISLDKTGKGVVTFTRAELYKLGSDSGSHYGSSFSFNSSFFYVGVTVTNDVTGKNVTSKASIYFGSGISGLTVNGLATNFKPGLSLPNYATVVDYRSSLGRYYPNASIRLNVSYSDGKDTWQNLVQKDVKTDNIGFGLYTIESVPGNATALKIQGTSGNETNFVALPPFRSPSRAFLQLELKTAHVKIKKSVAVEVRSNIAFSIFTVQVYAVGALVMTKVERRSVQDKSHAFTFTMTSEMAPVADVVVFVTTNTGEIAADRLPVGVDFSKDNKVTISFSTPKVTRGSAVRVTVEAKPRTKVFLMAWSKWNFFDKFISYQI
ncbi:CD109 antigen-like [Littorina saxatilis]|uniref:CD109 antigen-like n=1 Tax=Littorina saxatilis TaxID=31220 RepID=UPI0038B452E6